MESKIIKQTSDYSKRETDRYGEQTSGYWGKRVEGKSKIGVGD